MMRDLEEQVKEVQTVDEMRAELYRLENYLPMVRAVAQMARYKGLSAEDHYTILAYHAVQSRQVLLASMLSDASCQTTRFMYVPGSVDPKPDPLHDEHVAAAVREQCAQLVERLNRDGLPAHELAKRIRRHP